MYPPYFLDATIRNQGMATFDEIGNVYTTDGKPSKTMTSGISDLPT